MYRVALTPKPEERRAEGRVEVEFTFEDEFLEDAYYADKIVFNTVRP